MKMLFHNGKIEENAKGIGIGKIHFSTNGMDILHAFSESLWYITGIISAYDIEHYKRVNNKDIFFFYQKLVFSQQEHRVADKQSIITELDAIMNGSTDNIVNWEDTMMKEAVEGTNLNDGTGIYQKPVYVEEKIYWDTLNNFIVIIGAEQLAKFASALEEEKWKNALSIYPGSQIEEFINEETMSEPVKKMLLLANDKK